MGRTLDLRGITINPGHIVTAKPHALGALSPLALWNDAKRDDKHGTDPQSCHQDLDQEFTCAGRPMRRHYTCAQLRHEAKNS